MQTTLVTPTLLAHHLEDPHWIVLDIRHDLMHPERWGEDQYRAGHVPGAAFLHLDRDLSAPKTGRNGRHPLPSAYHAAATFARVGVAPETQVVVYDQNNGMYASRAWWMLRWLGHDAVAVLDGGRAAWRAGGGSLETAIPAVQNAPPYPLSTTTMPTVPTDRLLGLLGKVTVLDARAGERFRGETEPFDPVAGHIPGARNRFHKDNLQADGRFRSAAELRAAFAPFGEPTGCVHQCGSGVTACHNLLAMEHAGLTGSALYPGSWSEWCADPGRPIAKG